MDNQNDLPNPDSEANASPPAPELSGAAWVQRFPGSNRTDSLEDGFRQSCERFLGALQKAGATVTISATHRPAERAYLMHWCYLIYKENIDPAQVPPLAGVAIIWNHGDRNRSKVAAGEMVSGFALSNLEVALSLSSRHTERRAIDMTIAWTGEALNIARADGTLAVIHSLPHDGMNVELQAVGRGYGVIKFVGGAKDKPHWSTDGR